MARAAGQLVTESVVTITPRVMLSLRLIPPAGRSIILTIQPDALAAYRQFRGWSHAHLRFDIHLQRGESGHPGIIWDSNASLSQTAIQHPWSTVGCTRLNQLRCQRQHEPWRLAVFLR